MHWHLDHNGGPTCGIRWGRKPGSRSFGVQHIYWHGAYEVLAAKGVRYLTWSYLQSSVGLLQKLERACFGSAPKAMEMVKTKHVDDIVSIFNFRIRRSRMFILMACLEVSGELASPE